MKETKKIRVKVKKRKLKIKSIIIALSGIILIVNLVYCILNIKIQNIYIIDNNILSDKEIIKEAKINDYPPYMLSLGFKIEKNILNNDYIKEVKVKKRLFKVYIYIEEYKPLAIYNGKVLLDNNSLVENTYNLKQIPVILKDVNTLEFSKSFEKVNNNILSKISQIEYAPNEVDKNRYLLYMNDGNSVYVTLEKITKINKYNSIVSQMNEKKGIIYLDSGDYVELK